MTTADKIRLEHLNRRACVYLRQSTMAQLVTHKESTARQYALRKRAVDLGWPKEHVEVIDEDLGQSGQTANQRSGFQRLAEDVAHGRVGAIFAVEVSRLARSSADWHRLLELCSLADVLIADEHAVYRPHADYNDRLLLGFKGQMSEAESYWMRLRLHGAKMSKARRGKLKFKLPPGLVWVGDQIELTPDESVRKALAFIFERFLIDGSACRVARHMRQSGVRVPCLDTNGSLRWDEAKFRHVWSVLKNPLYAGTYAYGRRTNRLRLVEGEIRRKRDGIVPVEKWPICIQDSHPGYISWEEYMNNQKTLAGNHHERRYPDRRGAVRDGEGLLQGIVLCGRCGLRMRVKYIGRTNTTYYYCERGRLEGEPSCWTLAAKPVDDAVEKLFLQAMQPAEIDLSFAVIRQVEKQSADVDAQWKLRLERSRYEVRQAERRYRSVDSENRLVARTLEREWEEKLAETAALEREHEEARRHQRLDLTDADRMSILALAKNLPRVWRAPTTKPSDRKSLLRLVIRDVILRPVDVPRRETLVQVVWQTGATTKVSVQRPGRGVHIRTAPEALNLIRKLAAEEQSDTEIASALNAQGILTGTGQKWNTLRVNLIRQRHGIRKRSPRAATLPDRREDGAYSVRGAAKALGVSDRIIYTWNKIGWLRGERDERRAWWFKLDERTVARLARSARG